MSRRSAASNLLDLARGEAPAVSSVQSLVAPVALLLALRWADEHDAEQLAIAAFNGEEARPILPKSLRWPHWRSDPRPLTQTEVSALWSGIRATLGLPGDPRNIHDEVRLPSGRLLFDLIAWVDRLTLDTPQARREAGEAFTDLVLQAMDVARFGGELFTPRKMGDLMVALADPRPGERVYDPCFGTGGLLVGVAEALWIQGRDLAPGEWARVQRIPVFGVEKHGELHLVAFVRLLLAGVRPALEVGDALERDAAGRHQDQGFDCVITDPPWGAKLEPGNFYDFPVRSRNSENLFLQHALRSLRPGGRAVVSVPPGFLTRGGGDYELRRWLLSECQVELVVRLPAKSLRHTAIAPTLLVVRRTSPAPIVRFVELRGIPDSAQASRALARAVLGGDPTTVSVDVREVPVAELLKADARLVPPEATEAITTERLRALSNALEMRPLHQVASVIAGHAVRRDTIVEGPGPGGIPIVRVGDLREGVLRFGERRIRSDAKVDIRDEQWVQHGDILISLDGTIGKTLLVMDTVPRTDGLPEGEGFAVAQKGLAIVRARDVINPRLLAAVLASETFQAQMRQLARGEIIAHLPLNALRNLLVPVPPPSIQRLVLRRLSDRPGDAVDAILYAVAGDDRGPLSRLFTEDSAISRLTAEGLPEPEELYELGLDAFGALRTLRNEAAHAAIDVGPTALRWLLTVGAAPVIAGRRRAQVLDFEILDATRTMLERALEAAHEVGGLVGRRAARLTERLMLWADVARTRVASDFRLNIEHRFEELLERGAGRLLVTVTLLGAAPLREFSGRIDAIDESIRLSHVTPGEPEDLLFSVPEDLPWVVDQDSLVLKCEFVWSARRVDEEPASGSEPIVLRRPISEGDGPLQSLDLGVSPYITGDVVENPAMFVGRQSILDDIRTHLGGGTKVILLEGNRRTGKTSILRQLQRREMGMLDSWVPVECSLQGTVGDATKDGIPTEGVFRLIVRDIGLACAKVGIAVPLPEMEATADINAFRFRFAHALNQFFTGIEPYEALQIYVDMVVDAIKPRRLLLMLDEFDKLQVGIDNGVTSPQVPENIRNLLQTRSAVSAIVTGSRRLKRLREEYWSALFGFGHRIGIDPLELTEVRELVTKPVAGRLAFDDESVGLIADLTARQPYLVQSLCARVFELAKRHGWRRIQREEVLEAVTRMVKDNEHFQALWGYAETERRRYILCLCNRLREATQRLNAALLNEHLNEAGIVVTIEHVDDDLRFLVELELIAMVNTPLGSHYDLAIPLMRRWMELNIDAEAQRRKALQEQTDRTGYGHAVVPQRAPIDARQVGPKGERS